MNTLFQCSNLSKHYPGVKALDGVSLELRAGEVHALMGENGAGKSTFSKLLAGIQKQTAGEMKLGGEGYAPSSRKEAELRGVSMVTQEFSLVPFLSIAENLFLSRLPKKWGVLQSRELHEMALPWMEAVGLGDKHPRMLVSELGVGEKQLVEIAVGLTKESQLLILDEPTAALTHREVELLFEQIERLKQREVCVLYISHRMEEIQRIADRVSVLRDGQYVGTKEIAALGDDELIQMMTGKQVEEDKIYQERSISARVVLDVKRVEVPGKVKEASFQVRAGEIVGIAGLMGAGRTELVSALFGADEAAQGEMDFLGEVVDLQSWSCHEAVAKGMALLTEDRKEQGLFLEQSIRENASFPNLGRCQSRGVLSASDEAALGKRAVEELGIRCRDDQQLAGELSGGNQQKIVIAKWLIRGGELFVFDEPTRGIDVGARFEIYQLMNRLAAEGKALLVVSSDLKELTNLCDRILVMSGGRLESSFDRGEWSEENILKEAFKYA